MKNQVSSAVRNWLFIGVVMVFFQVVIGGVTRLTDSGLSITEWAVIQGTLPPLNEVEWQAAFEKYKVAAKKQFESLHADMTLAEFKVIFFWEYFHRLWARLMGFVFLIPFVWFLFKKQMPGWLIRRLGVVIGLASLAAVFGFIMVKSGLNDDTRTWVSAYKLAVHLSIATALFAYLFWTWLMTRQPGPASPQVTALKKLGWAVVTVLLVQIVFGGLMAGMRAALIHPHFPVFVEGARFWSALTASADTSQIVDYEPNIFIKAIVQLFHRGTAWLLTGMTIFLFFRIKNSQPGKNLLFGAKLMIGMLAVQFLLGVFTIINSFGKVPLFYGAAHQAGALILLAVLLFVVFHLSGKKGTKGVENGVDYSI